MSVRETLFTNLANLCIGSISLVAGSNPADAIVTGAMAMSGLIGLGLRVSENNGLHCAAVRKRMMQRIEKKYGELCSSREFNFHLQRAKDIIEADLSGSGLEVEAVVKATEEGFPDGVRTLLLERLPFEADERAGLTFKIVSDALDEGLQACRASPDFMAQLSAEVILAAAPTLNMILQEHRDSNQRLVRIEVATETTKIATAQLTQGIQDLLPKLDAHEGQLDRILTDIDTVLSQAYPKARQPELEKMERDGISSYFGARAIPHVGRDDELEELARFIDDPDYFRWLQIAGDAGQGKSRLALELCLSMTADGGTAGFLSRTCLADETFPWAEWQPDAPTLIVIDYLIGFEVDLSRIFLTLARRENLNHPVRLILLERRRFDQAEMRLLTGRSAAGEEANERFQPEIQGRSEWFTRIVRRHDGRDPFVDKTVWSTPILQLRGLTSDDLLSIYHAYCERKGRDPEIADQRLLRLLRDTDLQGRPLFAYLLADALDALQEGDGLSIEQLLTQLLEKDHRTRWAPVFDGIAPTLMDKHPALELAVLATMAGALSLQTLHEDILSGPVTAQVIRQALEINDSPSRHGAAGPAQTIPALEPDLIGEWLVLSALAHRPDRLARWVGFLWETYPNELANFLLRASQDFAGHSALDGLFDACPQEAEANPLAGIAASVVKAYSDMDLLEATPKGILHPLERAADEGDPRALINLGLHYRYGINVDEDPARAFKLFRAAEDLDHPRGRDWVDWCYKNGYGVSGGDALTNLRRFERNAAAGIGSAMFELGKLYFMGRSKDAPKNYAKAHHWMLAAEQAEVHSANEYLAVMAMNGFGTPVDFDDARQRLERAIDAGSNTAITRLRLLATKSPEIEVSPEQIVQWNKRAAGAGSVSAMLNLAVSYETGLGTEPSLRDAQTWYEKAMRHGSEKARARLNALLETVE